MPPPPLIMKRHKQIQLKSLPFASYLRFFQINVVRISFSFGRLSLLRYVSLSLCYTYSQDAVYKFKVNSFVKVAV